MQLRVAEIKKVTDRISLFTLTGEGALPAYTAGAHLDFDLGKSGTRSYSLIDFEPVEDHPQAYHIAVQAEPEGDGGSLAMHALASGSQIAASEPKNSFELHAGGCPVRCDHGAT